MSYQSEIGETTVSPIAELYEFRLPDSTLRLTSHVKSIDDWERAVVTRGAITKKVSERGGLDVSVQANSNLLRLVASYTLPYVRLILYHRFLDTGTQVAIFGGEASTITLKGDTVNMTFIPPTERLKYVVPRKQYRVQCNNRLFDQTCGLSPYSWSVQAVVTVDGSKLQSSVFATKPDGWFTLGWAQYGHEYRMITHHEGDTIWLHLPFDADVEGEEVWAYAGCDGSPETCKQKFDNFAHFTGFPFIPSQNPTLWGLGEPKIP